MVRLRVIQWNVSVRSRIDGIGAFLQSLILDEVPTIVCLQEVQEHLYVGLTKVLRPDGAAYSLAFRTPGKYEGKNRRMGVAILVFNASIIEAGLLDRTVFPERTIWCRAAIFGVPIKIVSFHSLTGVGYKNAKASNFSTIADYLEQDPALDFLCFDANEPKTDSKKIRELEFWPGNGDKGRNASLIMGSDKVHSLEDSFRKYLHESSDHESIQLPITHSTNGFGRRYDYVFSSPIWHVEAIHHPFEASLNASSDHSAVVVDFNALND